jgi:hypothetical protein
LPAISVGADVSV